MQAPPTNHITTTMQPRPYHGGFPGKPRTLSLFPLLFSPAQDTYPAITMPLGPINRIAITTGPRPTHGGYSPPALHQPANHPQTNNSAYPRALKRGGRRRRTPPTTTTITGNTSTRTQTIKSGQLTLLNPSPRHQNYTTPPHHMNTRPPGTISVCLWFFFFAFSAFFCTKFVKDCRRHANSANVAAKNHIQHTYAHYTWTEATLAREQALSVAE